MPKHHCICSSPFSRIRLAVKLNIVQLGVCVRACVRARACVCACAQVGVCIDTCSWHTKLWWRERIYQRLHLLVLFRHSVGLSKNVFFVWIGLLLLIMKVAINSVLVWNSMWYFVRSKCMLPQTMETLGLKTKNLPRTRTSHFVNETEVCHNPQIHRFYRRQKKICDILNRTTLKYNVFLGKSKDKFFFGGHNTLTKLCL